MRHTVSLGATDLDVLREALRRRGIKTNAYFDVLWPHVPIAEPPAVFEVVIATAAALGLPHGATLGALVAHVAGLGLGPCPLEAAPRLSLLLEEPPDAGRITVVSSRVFPDEAAPRGFYLRCDAEGQWLRAYVASDDWCFDAEERFALAVAPG